MSDALEQRVFQITRPAPALFTVYLLSSFLTGPFFFIPLLMLWFRYRTLQYAFDEEGVTMRWGILFRREISLTYARIQDIHLSSNLIDRWFGLAKIEIQTASGSSSAEMTIEGVHEFEEVRDFLYSRMRGVKSSPMGRGAGALAAGRTHAGIDAAQGEQLAKVLGQVADELQSIRSLLEQRPR